MKLPLARAARLERRRDVGRCAPAIRHRRASRERLAAVEVPPVAA